MTTIGMRLLLAVLLVAPTLHTSDAAPLKHRTVDGLHHAFRLVQIRRIVQIASQTHLLTIPLDKNEPATRLTQLGEQIRALQRTDAATIAPARPEQFLACRATSLAWKKSEKVRRQVRLLLADAAKLKFRMRLQRHSNSVDDTPFVEDSFAIQIGRRH